METLVCGLCGFEFERGRQICQGCHGQIKYGSGILKWIYAIFFSALTYGILWIIDKYIISLHDDFFSLTMIAFFVGMYKAIKKYKYSYSVEKAAS